MDRTVANLMVNFPCIGELLAKRIAAWYIGLPSKEVSPADVWSSPFHRELVEAGVEEYQLADHFDGSPDDWVNSNEYRAILNDHYCSDYEADVDSYHYASGMNQLGELTEIPEEDDVYIKVVDHVVEVICPVCFVKEHKETSAEAEAFLDLHYTEHVKIWTHWISKEME